MTMTLDAVAGLTANVMANVSPFFTLLNSHLITAAVTLQFAALPFRVASNTGTDAPFVMSASKYSFARLLSWNVNEVVKPA